MNTQTITNQEIFNKVWHHFIVEEKPLSFVVDPDSGKVSCRYRDHEGNSCAFGIFVTDEFYERRGRSYEGSDLIRFLRDPKFSFFKEESVQLLNGLQGCHDWSCRENPELTQEGAQKRRETLRDKLSNLAKEYNLEIPA